jgi:hypothetical protein
MRKTDELPDVPPGKRAKGSAFRLARLRIARFIIWLVKSARL